MAARARHITHAHTMAETMDVITSEMVFRSSKTPPINRFTSQFYTSVRSPECLSRVLYGMGQLANLDAHRTSFVA